MEKPPKRIDLTHLSQNPVETAEGDTLGEVTELVANAEEGRIEYVKLRIRSQPNVGSLTVTVPWSQFELGGFGDCLQLDISRSVLESVASRSEPRH